jgi:hypothetical protein
VEQARSKPQAAENWHFVDKNTLQVSSEAAAGV